MQLRAWMESNDKSLDDVSEELKRLAPDVRGISPSMVSRHAAGLITPTPRQQDLYLTLTGAAVTPNDWFALGKNPELGRKPEKPKEPEADDAERLRA